MQHQRMDIAAEAVYPIYLQFSVHRTQCTRKIGSKEGHLGSQIQSVRSSKNRAAARWIGDRAFQEYHPRHPTRPYYQGDLRVLQRRSHDVACALHVA
jgi:hypothetical protein